jgi:hypothetical protein
VNQTPFLSVSATSSPQTHLVVVSPALPRSSPDELPEATLCGRKVTAGADVHPAEVECIRCLLRAPMFMGLPGFEVRL